MGIFDPHSVPTAFIIFAKVPFYFRKIAFIMDYYCLLEAGLIFKSPKPAIHFIIRFQENRFDPEFDLLI